MGWWTIGWPANGKRGFGVLNDKGRNRVPEDQTRTNSECVNTNDTNTCIDRYTRAKHVPLVGPPTMITATTFSSITENSDPATTVSLTSSFKLQNWSYSVTVMQSRVAELTSLWRGQMEALTGFDRTVTKACFLWHDDGSKGRPPNDVVSLFFFFYFSLHFGLKCIITLVLWLFTFTNPHTKKIIKVTPYPKKSIQVPNSHPLFLELY